MAWFHCQFCDLLRELSDEHIGKPAKCPNCKKRGTVVGTHESELPTIGRVVDDDHNSQPTDIESVGHFWNRFVQPSGTPVPAAAITESPEDEIDDWQSDSPDSTVQSTPHPQQVSTESNPLRNKVQGLYERVAEWSVKDSTGRVFETYITVRYLRWAWKVAFFATVLIWLIVVVGGTLSGIRLIFESVGDQETLRTYTGFAILKTIILVIGFGLFTMICLLELFVVRMSLETVAVFFDIAHDIRRLADGRPSLEQTSDTA